MEIVHVVLGKVNTNKMNGVNKVVDNLARNQTDLGHRVTIWGITKNPVHNYPVRNYHTELFFDRSKFSLPKGIQMVLGFIPKGTVFHFHGGFIPQFYFIAKLLRSKGFSYAFTSHGSYNTVAMERSYWKKKLFIQLFDKSLVTHAKSMHFIGASEIEGAQKLFDFKNFALIPNGQSFDEAQIPVTSDLNRFMVFGFCGRLDIKTKGLDLLFQAFAQFVKESQNTQVELWMLGDGEERKTLETLAKSLGVEDQIRFWGSVFGDKKLDLMRKFDFMVLTSRNEGLPGVILEAAALGVPSIVSKETNMASYLNKYESGLVLEKNDADHIHGAIKRAVEMRKSNEIQALKTASIAMISKEFDWKGIASQVVEMYV
jgi:glycosyltransferase involved in cell wall biosynthesis